MSTPVNLPPNHLPDSPAGRAQTLPAAASAPRPFYWSVRRELWENRSLYIAPLAVAGVILVGYSISLIGLPYGMRGMAGHGITDQQALSGMPYAHASWLLMLTAFLVAFFYCLDALHGERRDRSILFWKSLPVADRTTVLAKASIPMLVLPLLVLVLTVAVHLLMLLLASAVLFVEGAGAARSGSQLPFFQIELVLLYSWIVLALWHAPIYGWLLLVSGWAKRTTFLWAVFPLLAVAILEKLAFNTTHFASRVGYRLAGGIAEAFASRMPDGSPVDPHFIPLAQLTPGKFLGSSGLWVGLALTAIFLAGAVRLRRYREPI
jgi:ABC-2 type transport system permease protein